MCLGTLSDSGTQDHTLLRIPVLHIVLASFMSTQDKLEHFGRGSLN